MARVSLKFLLDMMNAIVLLVAKVHQAVIELEPVRVDDRVNSFTERFLMTCVYTLSFRLMSLDTIVLPPPPGL